MLIESPELYVGHVVKQAGGNPQAIFDTLTSQIAPERVESLSVALRELETEIDPGGGSAQVSGLVRPLEIEEDAPRGTIVLVAVGYGDADNVVGVRKWEVPLGGEALEIPFDVTVYSLGPPIVDVEVAAEYRQVGDPDTEANLP